MAMSCFDPFDQIVVVFLTHGVDQINAGSIDGADIRGSQDTDVRGDNRRCRNTFAVTRYGHVPHDVDIGDILAEEINCRLGGFGNLFHQFFFDNTPVIAVLGMDHTLADPAVGTADADVLVSTAETAHGMSLEVRQGKQGIIVCHVGAVRHMIEPFAAFDRQIHSAFLIHDVNIAELRPAVDLQCFAVLFRRVAVTCIEGVGFNNRGILQGRLIRQNFLYPGRRNDIRSVRLTGVQLDGNLAGHVGIDLLIGLHDTLRGKITGEINDGFIAGSFGHGNILSSVCHS